MKKLFLAITLVIISAFLFARAEDKVSGDEMETLIGNGKLAIGFFGGPEFKFTRALGDFAFMSGGKGGVLIDRVFGIGGAGYGLSTHHNITFSDGSKSEHLSFNYGGLLMEFTLEPKKAVHTVFSLLIGGGKASYIKNTVFGNEYNSTSLFVMEPEFDVEANIIRFIKVGVGAGYRIVVGSDLDYLSNSDLMGFSGSLYIKFGIDDVMKFIDVIKGKFDD